MNQFLKKIATPIIIIIILLAYNLQAQDSMKKGIWKKELQILLGFSGETVDGVMGIETFNALKRFAYHHDLEDVVLRGEFEDIEYWGFEQYLIKYHAYWIREIKNQRIFNDVHDKEYLRQADETLYSFEMAIQNAKLEVERLAQAKSRSKRLAEEKQELQKWEIEKEEAERLTLELRKSIMAAEVEVDKWSLERIRAKRLASEKEQLDLLSARKAEATRLTYELEDIIHSAKKEIDRLIDENKKMKELIANSEKTELMAEVLLNELGQTQGSLAEAQDQIQVLSDRNNTLEIKLNDTKVEIENMLNRSKNTWWKFWKKKEDASIDSLEQVDTTRWYQNFSLNINNNNLLLFNIDDSTNFKIVPTIALDIRYHLPIKSMNWDLVLEYSPSFTYINTTPFISGTIQTQFPLKWKFDMGIKMGVVNLSSFEEENYFSIASEISYVLPLNYKFISTSYFLSPQIMSSFSGSDESVMTYLSTGIRITID